MTSTARQALRAAATLTGMAALGAGVAAPAFAAEATLLPNVDVNQVVDSNKFHTAGVDGFNTESVVPTDAFANDLAHTLAAYNSRRHTADAGGLTSVTPDPFVFSLEPTGLNTAGEQQFDDLGMSPMTTPMMNHAVPAILGGQKISTADSSPDQGFGQDNGLPDPADGPVNGAASPVTGSVKPTTKGAFGALSDTTSNDGTTSNHEFQV